MMMVHNEGGRFLDIVLEHLNTFCDEIRAFDDASTDASLEILMARGAVVYHSPVSVFYEHEGRARNKLLDFTLEGEPTHIVAIDADEMIENTAAVRSAIENRTSPSGVWNLTMDEVWKASDEGLGLRVDGQWGARRAPILFEAPAYRRFSWRIADRALASGREPVPVAKAGIRSHQPPVCSVFHFGWTCEVDRQQRYDRYVKHDSGKFHPSPHLASIMWPDEQTQLQWRAWPAGLEAYRKRLLDRINP